MSYNVEYVTSHLFVGGFRGKLHTGNYFRCHEKSCPFALLMVVEEVDGQKVATTCRSVVLSVHDHTAGKTKIEKRRQILKDLKFINDHPHDPRSIALRNKHALWNKAARKESKKYRLHLIDIEAVKIYALDHPGVSAVQIKKECCPSMNERSIANIILLEKTKRGEAVDLADMIRQKSHHVLGNDGNDIVVFGQTSAIPFLANTTLIQGDGTFTCLVRPFTQIFIFHALLKNGVSYPLLYCLVRGKNEAIYERLINLIDEIALEHGTTIMNRPSER